MKAAAPVTTERTQQRLRMSRPTAHLARKVEALEPETSNDWAVFAIANPTDQQLDRIIVAPHYRLPGSGLFWPDLGSRRIVNITPSEGFALDREDAPDADIFRVTINPGAVVTFVAELASARLPQVYLWEPEAYKDTVNSYTLFRGIVIGIAGLLALFLTILFVVKGTTLFPATAALAWAVLAYVSIDFGFLNRVIEISPGSEQVWRAGSEVALALTLGVEFVVISGAIGRQNTVFKFYIQAWLLLSVVGGAAFAWLWASRPRWNASMRILWTAAVVLLAFVGVLYTVMATQGRAQDRFSQAVPLTLDGQAYIEYAIHPENGQFIELKPDLGIIRWMNENIEGLPIIMEAISNDGILYKWGGRISINTGLPAVIGWDWHQKQQRGLFNMPGFIEQRVGNVNAFYSTTDIPTAERIMSFYNVGYIVVGTLEHLYYPPESLEKFETMVQMGLLEQVYSDGDAIIYHVIHTNSLQVAMNTAN